MLIGALKRDRDLEKWQLRKTESKQDARAARKAEKRARKKQSKAKHVPKEHLRQIESWMGGRFWLYDNRAVESDESDHILQVFEQAYRRYHCKVFLVDNLMTVRTCKRESDFFQMQADFVVKLRKLAEKCP